MLMVITDVRLYSTPVSAQHIQSYLVLLATVILEFPMERGNGNIMAKAASHKPCVRPLHRANST